MPDLLTLARILIDHPIAGLLFLLCLTAIGYYGYGIVAALRFLSRPLDRNPDFHPPISILKPLHGSGEDLYENLASFCRQDYPEYQIIFGVRDYHDPSVKIVQQLAQDFPEIDIQLIINPRMIGTNAKICNLANASIAARHEILLLADSDVRVNSDYLRQIIQPLRDPKVAVVTCIYRSLTRGAIATLEALGTATDFQAGVLVSTYLEGIQFAMGQTILIRQSVLDEIGGFEAIADYLADDFQLGYLPAQAGYRVALSTYIVEHVLGATSLAACIQRQLRWTLCVRVSRLWGYLGLIFTHGVVASVLFCAVTGGTPLGWAVLSVVCSIRLVMAWLVGVRILDDPAVRKWLWLVPLRDILGFCLWGYGFVGDTVKWSDRQLKITPEGKLVPIATPAKS
jgi:ceramide glucosyltransferase